MEATIHNLLEAIQNFAVHSNPLIGIMLGVGLIILESMIPVLPLALFIAMNTILFGNFWGFIISWVSTICGCMLSFYIFRKGISSFLYKKLPEDGHILQFMRRITEIPFADLVVITAMPFTPAFSVNIAGGLSKINPRKFLAAIIIGKLPMVYFWGFIGTTFLESLGDPIILIRIAVMLLIVYIISKIVSKKFNLE
mgnify:FL=1